MQRYRQYSIALGLFMAVAQGGLLFAAGGVEESKGPIVVASKLDTEAVVLGTMIVEMLEANGFAVEDRTNFGTTDVIRKAITSDEIDIYPEYTGNGAFFYPGAASDAVWKDSAQGYETVKRLDQESYDLIWLQPGAGKQHLGNCGTPRSGRGRRPGYHERYG